MREVLIKDLALLLDAALHGRHDAPIYAERVAEQLGLGEDDGPGAAERLLRAAGGQRELDESQQFQIREARDILATWDEANPGGVSRETVLADQVRTLLAIIDGGCRDG
jgi:hypothetical protein